MGRWTSRSAAVELNRKGVRDAATERYYIARVTLTDANGNTAHCSVPVAVVGTFDFWRTNKFTAAEQMNADIIGAAADSDTDAFPSLIEYAMALEPESTNSTDTLCARFQ